MAGPPRHRLQRRLIANVLERVNDAARHVSCAAGTDFVPFSIGKKCNSFFEDMKCFVVIHVMMWRRPTAGRRDLRPHREFSGRPLAIEENRHFFAERMQYSHVLLPNYRGRTFAHRHLPTS